jgi:hypothetical protein
MPRDRAAYPDRRIDIDDPNADGHHRSKRLNENRHALLLDAREVKEVLISYGQTARDQ